MSEITAWAIFVAGMIVATIAGAKAYVTGSWLWFSTAMVTLAIVFIAGLQT